VKIAFLSTYPPAPCGIGDYAQQLRISVERAAADASIEVVAEHHIQVKSEVEPGVMRAWRRDTDWAGDAAASVIQSHPDVVHVQHEEAIMHQDGRVIRFLELVGAAGIARAVTLHSVYGGLVGPHLLWSPRRFHQGLAANSEAIIVHQRVKGRDTLERQGVAPNLIHVIPHGTPLLDCPSRQDARQRLNIPITAKMALFFGVIHQKKNLHTALEAAKIVAEQLPEFKFVIAGRPRERTVFDDLYVRRLRRHLEPGFDAGWLDFRNRFIADNDIAHYLAAADLVLFPHDQRYGSASGVFHLALGAGRASVCSSSPKFVEAQEIFGQQIPAAIAETRDVEAWAKSIESLLTNADLRRKAEGLARDAAISTSWENVGRLHAQLYRQLSETKAR
jgi:polysaccharide biosynthesis protein PslF